jgi:hypothetical protein
LAAAALALALVTQFNVTPRSTLTGAGMAFIIAALLFIAALWGRREIGASPNEQPAAGPAIPLWLEAALLLAIVGLAAFFRFYRFLSFPPGLWYDEGVFGTDAITIMERDHFTVWRSTNYGRPTLFLYLLVGSFKLFGFTLFAMRIVPALAGLAAVVAFYFLARRLLGPVPALAATALYAVSRYAVTFSRITWDPSLMPLLEIMAVYFLVTGLETRSKWRLALAGGSLAAGIYTYLAFRFVPVIIAVFLLYVAWREWPLIRRNILGLGIWAAAAVAVVAPLGQFAIRHQDEFLHRTRTVSVFKEIDQKDSWEPLRHNIEASIKMMNVAGDRNGRHNLPGEPMLDNVSAALLVLGAATSVWAWRRWRAGFALPWLVLTLVPGALPISICSGWVCPASVAYTWSTTLRNSEDLRWRGWGRFTLRSATTRPGSLSITTIRPAICTASSMLCVTIRMALVGIAPLVQSSSSSPRSASALSTSRAENGSSRHSSSGSTAIARAKPTF